MPCTADGITPDIIVNPHAIPSRMTIAQLLETLLGKVCALEGKVGDGTPFCNADVDTIAAALGEHGYESYGRETLVNGMTGEVLHGHVFLGPCAYQRLKHMVEDKVWPTEGLAATHLTRGFPAGAREGAKRAGATTHAPTTRRPRPRRRVACGRDGKGTGDHGGTTEGPRKTLRGAEFLLCGITPGRTVSSRMAPRPI